MLARRPYCMRGWAMLDDDEAGETTTGQDFIHVMRSFFTHINICLDDLPSLFLLTWWEGKARSQTNDELRLW